jgi:predicted dehydrogenase
MLGAGGMAIGWIRHFFPHFNDRMKIVGLADVQPEALNSSGDFLNLPASARFSTMADAFDATEADFCVIVVPPAYHEDAVMRAVERGMPILSEKPISDTWDACKRIYSAVTDAGLKMQVVQNYRFTPRILTMKQVIESGEIGKVRYVMSRFAADYRERNSWGKFRHEIDHGLLVEGSVHHFDQIRNLCGSNCASITGFDWNPGHPSFDGECCGQFVMRMESGSYANYEGNGLEAGTQNSWHKEFYRAECEGGAVSVDTDDVVRVFRHEPGKGVSVEEKELVRRTFEGHPAIIEQFLDWMDGGPAPDTQLQDNIYSSAMLFSAIEASETGRVVDVAAKAKEATG